MATCSTNVVLGSFGYGSATPHKPSSAALCRCSWAQSAQRGSWWNILVVESSGPRRRKLWDGQNRRSSPSFCLSTDVSSDASASTAEGNESGLSIEEKNAIIAFGVGSDVQEQVQEQEQEQEQTQEALEVMKEREKEVAALKRRASKAVKGQAATVTSIVVLFMGLLDRLPAEDGRMIGGVGSAVMERVEEEVFMLQGVEGVDRQSVFEILRLVKLLQMDIQLIAAARKENTLTERLVEAKAHCRQFLNILSTL